MTSLPARRLMCVCMRASLTDGCCLCRWRVGTAKDGKVSYVQLGRWYNSEGHKSVPWVELLDTRKWPQVSLSDDDDDDDDDYTTGDAEYNLGGFDELPWLELLDLRKWPSS